MEWLADKITEFFTLRWLEEKPSCPLQEERIEIDDADGKEFMLGCARFLEGDKVELTIWNTAPVHLEIYPVEYPVGKVIELTRTGIYAVGDRTIITPRSSAKWTINLLPGESITFEAYFCSDTNTVFLGKNKKKFR